MTVPFFQLGTCAVLASPFVSPWLALPGLLTMAFVMLIQGRGHAMEETKPVPFRSALDVTARIFAEQWITFPRYVLSGAFGRAWKESGSR